MQIQTEVALFVHLLPRPEFSKTTKVDYWRMAIEFNNRLMQAFLAGKPLDAYPKTSIELCKFGDDCVRRTRERDSLLMLGFPQALAAIPVPQPQIFQPPSSLDPMFPPLAPPPQPAAQHAAAQADPPQNAVAFQPAPAPLFAAAAAAVRRPATGANVKRYRDPDAGKKSNQGTQHGGKGVAKSCRACSIRAGAPVPANAEHQRSCEWCGYCHP